MMLLSTITSAYDEDEERNRQLVPSSEDSALGADSYDDCDQVEAGDSVQMLYSSLEDNQRCSQQSTIQRLVCYQFSFNLQSGISSSPSLCLSHFPENAEIFSVLL